MVRRRVVGAVLSVALFTAGPAAAQGGLDLTSDTPASSSTDSTAERSGGLTGGDRPSALNGTTRRFGEKGTIEASGMVGLSVGSISDQFTFTMNLDPYVGYFVADQIELGVRPGFLLTVGDDVETAINLMVNPNYHFALNDWLVPFAGVSLGITRGVTLGIADTRVSAGVLNGDVGFAGGLEGGVKIPVGNAGLVRLQAQFQAVFEPEIFNLNLAAGFGTYF